MKALKRQVGKIVIGLNLGCQKFVCMKKVESVNAFVWLQMSTSTQIVSMKRVRFLFNYTTSK
jgi:hypothetical protein